MADNFESTQSVLKIQNKHKIIYLVEFFKAMKWLKRYDQ